MPTEVIETDVLVVGGAAAAMRAAIEAHDMGAKVILATKGLMAKSGCSVGSAYYSAVGPWSQPGDEPIKHTEDLVKTGGYLADQEMMKIQHEEGKDRLLDLERWGAIFDRDEKGNVVTIQFAGHRFPRTLAFTPGPGQAAATGRMTSFVLGQQVRKRKIQVLEEVSLTRLLLKGNTVVGSILFDYKDGRPIAVGAKSTVIATGSFSQMYHRSSVAREDTGDGQVVVYRAGGELIDMEDTLFVTGGGTIKWKGKESKMINALGERFMLRYAPGEGAQFATKELMLRAVVTEAKEGRGSPNGGAYVDYRDLPWDTDPDFAKLYKGLREEAASRGFDVRKDPVEMEVVAHNTTGGIRVRGPTYVEASNLEGLYACGGVVGGMYGFDRPMGNTMMITQVFGKRAGEYAAKRAQSIPQPKPDQKQIDDEERRLSSILERKGGVPPLDVRSRLQNVFAQYAWALKNEASLRRALEEVEKLSREMMVPRDKGTTYNFEWLETIENENLLLLAKLHILGTLMRKESRACFLRDDYPHEDNHNWLVNIVCKLEKGADKLYTVPVDLKFFKPS